MTFGLGITFGLLNDPETGYYKAQLNYFETIRLHPFQRLLSTLLKMKKIDVPYDGLCRIETKFEVF